MALADCRRLSASEYVEHPPDEGLARPNDLACLIENANHRLQFPAGAVCLVSPGGEVLQALELVVWQTERLGDGVDPDAQDSDVRGRPLHFVDNPVSGLDVQFGNKGSTAESGCDGSDFIDRDIPQGAEGRGNAIVDAQTFWEDRSVIRHHLPGVWPFGITPNLPRWVPAGTLSCVKGPRNLLRVTSFRM